MKSFNELIKTAIPTKYPGYYISKEGVVLSISKTLGKRVLRGYKGRVRLYITTKKWVNRSVLSLMIEYILPKKPTAKHVLRHRDGDPTNNSDRNLRWGTRKQNKRDGIALGEIATKLTVTEVQKIRWLSSKGKSISELAVRFGVGRGSISNIIYRRTWNHI